LLKSGRIEFGIAIENKRQPFENSRQSLLGLNGEARLADGLNGLFAGEADSLSICGMGGESMVAILNAHPERVPKKLVLQPNRRPELVREWALENEFHLVDEQIARGHWPYAVLSYRLASGGDPAYQNEDRDAQLMFGPMTIQRRDPLFVDQLIDERRYLLDLERLSETSGHRLQVIEGVLRKWNVDVSR
jgi:tRNA (adenine22-N1)-methyltransferase